VLPLVGLLHHALKEILAVRVQPGFDFGEVGPQLFRHDDACRKLPVLFIASMESKRQACCDVPDGTEGTGGLN
jgi:hypothetical protein